MFVAQFKTRGTIYMQIRVTIYMQIAIKIAINHSKKNEEKTNNKKKKRGLPNIREITKREKKIVTIVKYSLIFKATSDDNSLHF